MGSKGRAPVGGLGDKVPQKLKFFCETTHNICIKIQQTTVAVTRVDILNDITCKILGGHVPRPIGIDAPETDDALQLAVIVSIICTSDRDYFRIVLHRFLSIQSK